MRFACLALVLTPAAGFGQRPDGPPTEGRPPVVPAVPLSADEEARRNALAEFGTARLRQTADRLAEAEKRYRASAQAAPDSPEPFRELAKVSAALGRDPAAIRAARRVLELDPTDGETAELLGKLLFEANQFAEAANAYRQAADAKTYADRHAARLRCLQRAATAFEKSAGSAAAESALRSALDVLAAKRNVLIGDGMTVAEHARFRAELYERLGRAQLAQRKTDAAVAAFETARDLFADPKQGNDRAAALRLHQNLAEVHAAAGQPDKAVAEHAKYLKYGPSGVSVYVRHAELLRAADPRANVAAAMNRLAADNPRNLAPRWVAAAELARTDFPAAHQQFQLLAPSADRAELFPILVAAYQKADRPKELLAVIEDVYRAAKPRPAKKAAVDPDEEDTGAADRASVDRARQLTAAVKAVPQLTGPLVRQLSTATDLKATEVYELVTGLAMRHGYTDTMTDVLLAAARRNPNRKTDSGVTWLLIDVLAKQRRWRELASAAEEFKDLPNNFINTGIASQAAIAFAELGEEGKAMAALKRIEGRIYIRLQTARVYQALGKPKQAAAECEDILKVDRPRGAELKSVRVTYSHALLAVKEFDKAEAELRAILEDDPDDVLALNNLGYNLADQGRKLPEAEALIRRAIELDTFERRKKGTPEAVAGTYLDSLAWVLFRRGKAEEARTLFEQVIATPDAGHDPVVWDHLGDVYFRLGEKAKAKAAWEKAADFFADNHQGREAGRLDEVTRKIGLTK